MADDDGTTLGLRVDVQGGAASAAELDKPAKSMAKLAKTAKQATKETTDSVTRMEKTTRTATDKVDRALKSNSRLFEQLGKAAAAGSREAMDQLVRYSKEIGPTMERTARDAVARMARAGDGAEAAAAQRGFRNMGQKMSKGFSDGFKQTFAGVLGANLVTSLFTGAGRFISGGIEGASNQGEALDLAQRNFGNSTGQIVGTSDTSANAMGLSKADYLSYSARMGTVLRGAGMSQQDAANLTQTLLQRGVDLRSRDNTDISEQMNGVVSYMIGEYEPARANGITGSDATMSAYARSQGKDWSKMSEKQKQIMRAQQYLTDPSSASAAGNFSQTVGASYANQAQQLEATTADTEATLGIMLLPLAKEAVEVLKNILDVLKTVFGWVGDFFHKPVNTANGGGTAWNNQGNNAALPGAVAVGGGAVNAPVVNGQLPTVVNRGGTYGSHVNTQVYAPTYGTGPHANGGVIPGYAPGWDTVNAKLSPGEGILVPELTAAIGPGAINRANAAASRNRYANGGVAGGDAGLKRLMMMASGQISGIYLPGTGGTSSNQPAGSVPGAAAPALDASSGVIPEAQFLALAQQIMVAKGFDPVDAYIVANQAMHESSFRVNPPDPPAAYDKNTRNGTPSRGILQFIKPTFDAYHDPGFDNWMGVADQIRAFLNYVPATYGSRNPSHQGLGYLPEIGYSAYDEGGWLQPNSLGVNMLPKPEPVLTPQQWDIAKSAIDQSAGGAGYHIGSIQITIGSGLTPQQVHDHVVAAIPEGIERHSREQNGRALNKVGG